MQVESPAFEANQPIPATFTCIAENLAPPLNFLEIPGGTKTLAIIMDDPDAPHGVFVHWVGWGLSPVASLPQGSSFPREGKNGFGEIGYGGPCPPPGKPHRYFFKVYALDAEIDLPVGSSKADLEKAMKGHILSQGQLVGTFKR